MPRLIVLPDAANLVEDVPETFLLAEEVRADDLNDEHTSVQLLERLEWALEGRPPLREHPPLR